MVLTTQISILQLNQYIIRLKHVAAICTQHRLAALDSKIFLLRFHLYSHWQKHTHKHKVFMWPAHYFCPTNQIWIFTTHINENFRYPIFKKNPLSGSPDDTWINRETDMTKLTDAFCDYMNATRKRHTQKWP
jgi:hypothetical protein